jgi:hypothetical protein
MDQHYLVSAEFRTSIIQEWLVREENQEKAVEHHPSGVFLGETAGRVGEMVEESSEAVPVSQEEAKRIRRENDDGGGPDGELTEGRTTETRPVRREGYHTRFDEDVARVIEERDGLLNFQFQFGGAGISTTIRVVAPTPEKAVDKVRSMLEDFRQYEGTNHSGYEGVEYFDIHLWPEKVDGLDISFRDTEIVETSIAEISSVSA